MELLCVAIYRCVHSARAQARDEPPEGVGFWGRYIVAVFVIGDFVLFLEGGLGDGELINGSVYSK